MRLNYIVDERVKCAKGSTLIMLNRNCLKINNVQGIRICMDTMCLYPSVHALHNLNYLFSINFVAMFLYRIFNISHLLPQLKHPNIVCLIEVCREANKVFFVLEKTCTR